MNDQVTLIVAGKGEPRSDRLRRAPLCDGPDSRRMLGHGLGAEWTRRVEVHPDRLAEINMDPATIMWCVEQDP